MKNYYFLFIIAMLGCLVLYLTIHIMKHTAESTLTAVTYRAKNWKFNSDNRYQFDYRYINSNWRAYIRRTPNLGSYTEEYVLTNRIYDNGQYYICIPRPISSLDEIIKLSHVWADKMQSYLNKEH